MANTECYDLAKRAVYRVQDAYDAVERGDIAWAQQLLDAAQASIATLQLRLKETPARTDRLEGETSLG